MIVLSNIHEMYDGLTPNNDSLHHGVDLVIDEGVIHSVVPHQPNRSINDSCKIADCSKYTITPGIFDCHSHVTLLGISERALEAMNSEAALMYIERILYATLVDGGVTTIRDIGGATYFLKRIVDEGLMIGPRLKIAICMLSPTGGHADFRTRERDPSDISYLWMAAPGRPSSIVDGPWECRKRVREIAACGADLIKICTSGGIASPTDTLDQRSFTREEVDSICDEAFARGLRVAAHAHSKTGIEVAVDCGVHDIQHISFMDERIADKALQNQCTVTPTSWIMSKLLDEQGLSDFTRQKVRNAAEVHSRAVKIASDLGLKILAGTDPVLPGMHGKNYMEIASLIKDGLQPLSAWHAATGLAANEIGQEDAGALTPGKRADILVCQGPVINHPELLGQGGLIEVIKDGIAYRGGLEGLPQRSFYSLARELVNHKF